MAAQRLAAQPGLRAARELHRANPCTAGANEGGERIAMTAPVRVLLFPGAGPFCENRFTISFFVPFDLQARGPRLTVLLRAPIAG